MKGPLLCVHVAAARDQFRAAAASLMGRYLKIRLGEKIAFKRRCAPRMRERWAGVALRENLAAKSHQEVRDRTERDGGSERSRAVRRRQAERWM